MLIKGLDFHRNLCYAKTLIAGGTGNPQHSQAIPVPVHGRKIEACPCPHSRATAIQKQAELYRTEKGHFVHYVHANLFAHLYEFHWSTLGL